MGTKNLTYSCPFSSCWALGWCSEAAVRSPCRTYIIFITALCAGAVCLLVLFLAKPRQLIITIALTCPFQFQKIVKLKNIENYHACNLFSLTLHIALIIILTLHHVRVLLFSTSYWTWTIFTWRVLYFWNVNICVHTVWFAARCVALCCRAPARGCCTCSSPCARARIGPYTARRGALTILSFMLVARRYIS